MPPSRPWREAIFDESVVRTFEGREVTQRGATLPDPRPEGVPARSHRPGIWFTDEGKTPEMPAVRGSRKQGYVVIAAVADRRVGFVVDRLIGQQDIVIKALGKSRQEGARPVGATELGNQQVGLVPMRRRSSARVPADRTPNHRGTMDKTAMVRRGEVRSRRCNAGDEAGKRAEYPRVRRRRGVRDRDQQHRRDPKPPRSRRCRGPIPTWSVS